MTDKEYVEERDRLIPLAAEFAYSYMAASGIAKESLQAWNDRWNKVFHKRMDELARDRFRKGA